MSNKKAGKENRFMYKKMIKRRIVSIVAALVFLLALSGCGAAENEGSVYMNINAEKKYFIVQIFCKDMQIKLHLQNLNFQLYQKTESPHKDGTHRMRSVHKLNLRQNPFQSSQMNFR